MSANSVSIVAVRHTAVSREEGRCYGRFELPLAPSYPEDLAELIQQLSLAAKGRPVERVLSSGLTRCARLAEDLCAALSSETVILRPVIDGRLLEFSYGAWEAMPWSHIPEKELELWMQNWTSLRAGGSEGETLPEMLARVEWLCSELSQTVDAGVTVLVTHAGVIRCLHHLLNALPLEDCFSLEVPYGSVTEFAVPRTDIPGTNLVAPYEYTDYEKEW